MYVLVNGRLLGEARVPFRIFRKVARRLGWRYQSWEEGEVVDIETEHTDVMEKLR
ncbi:U exon protein [Equine adenovirus 1]|uniref:U exon protein n=1 Tax=Equine adenovirus A serotype 1 TaxID=46916 RepID=G5CZ94_ADEE1|nr:U exon protein [Equine adenovirus 1]AEP16424.1 U exon protein [Equine adenovirus 1]ANG08574.1 U exon protein [Equine adenovirus 1]